MRIGIVGAENSHTVAIAKTLNVDNAVPGFEVTHVWGETPEFAALLPARLQETTQKGFALYETAQLGRDGRVVPTEVSARIIEPLVVTPPRALSESLTPRSCAPGATPSRPVTP